MNMIAVTHNDVCNRIRRGRMPKIGTAGDTLLYISLSAFLMEKTSCFPSEDTLSVSTGMDRRTVQRCLKNLENSGFVRISRSNGGRDSNLYTLMLPDIDFGDDLGAASSTAGAASCPSRGGATPPLGRHSVHLGAAPCRPNPERSQNVNQNSNSPREADELLDWFKAESGPAMDRLDARTFYVVLHNVGVDAFPENEKMDALRYVVSKAQLFTDLRSPQHFVLKKLEEFVKTHAVGVQAKTPDELVKEEYAKRDAELSRVDKDDIDEQNEIIERYDRRIASLRKKYREEVK